MYAVILAGSSGTRQHPLRAKDDPVSLRPTDDGRTLLRRIGDLIEPIVDPMDVIAVTDRRFGERVRTVLPEARILTEPMGRNTAAALALATIAIRRPDDEQMLVICADHEVAQDDAFREAIATAAVEVVRGAAGVDRPLVTFGIRPTNPDREFSYIQPGYDDGERIGRLRVYPVIGFEAKPENGHVAAFAKRRLLSGHAGVRQKNNDQCTRTGAVRISVHRICDFPRLNSGVDTTNDASILVAFRVEQRGVRPLLFHSLSRVSLA